MPSSLAMRIRIGHPGRSTVRQRQQAGPPLASFQQAELLHIEHRAMHVTLVHNPTAGQGSPGSDELCALLRAAGHQPYYVSSTDKKELRRALEDAEDLVLVAGGDGTVEKVARRLAGRSVPMAILPFGTSNNVATTLGVSGSAAEVIARLNEATPCRLDL